MPSPGRRTTPPPPRISSRHSPPGGRRRSPERRRPGPPSRGGGGSSSSTRGRSRESRRSPPVHTQPQRHADNRSRPRRSRSPPPARIRTPPPQRVRTPPIQRIRTPPPPAPLPRSFPVASSGTKRKVPPKEQRGRIPNRGHENGSHRSSSRTVISPPRKMIRSRSPRPRQEIPLIGPADDPVPRDYRSRSSLTYSVAMSPPEIKGRLISPPLPLTDRFRNDSANVFKGADGEFNMSELRNTRIHVILNPQNIEHNEIDPAHLSVVRRPGEGSKPIFARDEILQATHSPDKYESKYESKYEPNEHERIVIVDTRPALREGVRYTSPSRYEPERYDGPSTSRDTRYNGNEDYRPAREYDRPATSYDQRENLRTERQGGDLRLQLEYRHDSSRYSVEGGRAPERSQDHRAGSSSDLRARLVEKRTDRHDERSYVDRPVERDRRPSPVERDRRPSPVERRRPAEFPEHTRHERGEPEMRREPEVRRGEYEGRRPAGDFEGRRPHAEPETRRPTTESGSRRPRAEFETRVSRVESSSRRRHASDGRPPRDGESRRRRSRDEQSPEHYHGDPDEEYSDQPREWDSNPEHVPRGGLYFEHDNREEDMPHMSGRGGGMTRMRGSNYRGRGQRGSPMMRGGSSIRGVRLPFRGTPYPRGFPPTRLPRRGYPPRSGRKSSPKWEHDMFDTLSDQPAN